MLSNSAIMILVMVAIVITVLIGVKFDNNIGLIGIAFAFLIGSWLGPATIYEVIAYWPVNIMFILLVTSVFFGYASNNGTLSALADRIVYVTKGIPWFTPISVFLTAFIISGLGVGVWGIVFVAPIGSYTRCYCYKCGCFGHRGAALGCRGTYKHRSYTECGMGKSRGSH